MISKRFLISLLFLPILVSCALAAADLNYPYGKINLSVPPSENPFPGFGTHYSTLCFGMKTAKWNPASLAKLKLTEASISWVSAMGSYNMEKEFTVNEQSGSFEAGGGSTSSAGQYAIFFRPPGSISGMRTKEVDVLTHVNYATSASGIDFSSALRVNDWLVVGFSQGNPLTATMDLAGDVPTTARMATNLYGTNLDQMQIQTSGKLKYTFPSGGTVTTYESTTPLWSGFLSQEATLPITNISEMRNNMNIESPYTGTIASRVGKFFFGMNLIPINATANIENDIRAVINSGTEDIFLYTPNFDQNNQTDLATWISDPDKYGTSGGYVRKQLKTHAGEIVGTAKYKGYYSASTARLDLGTIYDVSDWFNIGLVFENIGGSSLNFKGTGISSYMNYREVNTQEVSNLNDLLQPGGSSTVDPLTNRWVTTFEAGGTKLYLEPEKNYSLPKRMRLGFLLKRPWLIAIDYETNQTSATIAGSLEASNINISNMNFLRFGIESRIFTLPWVMRFGTTLAFKPNVSGLSTAQQSSFDKAFKYGILPVRLDLGSLFNIWGGYDLTIAGGVNGMPIFNMLQVDVNNIDLTKMVYYGLTVKKDCWEANYQAVVDPLATASSYSNKPNPTTGNKSFDMSDVRFVQTLGITYRF